jgi:PAS domain S-box-containing protein
MTDQDDYTIVETLHAGADVTLYRGLRQLDGLPVVIKALRATAPRAIERLRHEYEIARHIDSPYVIRPYALETHELQLRLILEDFGGVPLSGLLGSPMELGRFLAIAIQLAAALADIHGQGVVHKDIKSANILIHPHTGALKLIDFGIASPLTPMPSAPSSTSLIEGSLAYMAPEQTGRMNRAIDHRSDLYALGVTFYELLTGMLPFQATDPLEWVHCHIARAPQSPREIVPAIPEPIAAIVLKLLAKQAEQRYQSARGLQADLQRCHEQWQALGRIEPFALGDRDVSELFIIPQKLYGREQELAELLHTFEQVLTDGQPALMLVSGYSGVGKSSLIQELHQPIVRARGYFSAGKLDQYQHDIPYATIVQAVRDLIQQILTESDERIQGWKAALAQVLGPNGQLMIDVIPQLELIIGAQPPVPRLPATEAQHRFHRVFQQFIGVFARHEHPLVLFLDDLQWLDPASLKLIAYVITHPDTRHLFFLGAYRDNELSPVHPLLSTLNEIRTRQPIHEILLEPLTLGHLEQLVADTVRRPIQQAAPLAHLVYSKTGGNPFFMIQFLTTLYQDGLLTYDDRDGSWRWELAQIGQQSFTDNVVELMVGKLLRLPAATQAALRLAACIGNTVEIGMLALICDQPEDELHAALWEAVDAGLLLRQDDSYRFLHDRVQEAAYALLPEQQRAAQHLGIGRRLLAGMPEERLAEHIFAIVSQLNRGAALIASSAESERLAELNLIAGRRAKAATAFTAARTYFAAGAALLDPDAWEARYELAFALYLEQAECASLSGALAEADQLVPMLMRHARTLLEQAAVYRVQIDIQIIKGEGRQAIENILVCLRLFGIEIPAHPSADEVQEAYQAVWHNLSDRHIEELIDLPLMTDPEMHAAMNILASLYIPAFNSDQNLFNLHLCYGVNLSLRHGNTPASVQFYGWFGLILAIVFHRYQEGYHFAKLAYDLMERHQFLAYKAKANNQMRLISYWTQPLDTMLAYSRAAFEAAVAIGDVPVACFSCYDIVLGMLLRGDRLSDVQREIERGCDFVQQAGFRDVYDMIVGMERFVQAMRGGTRHLSTYDDDRFSEAAFEAELERDRMPSLVCYYYVMKLMARFLSGDYEAALAAGERSKALLWAAVFARPRHAFYYALALAALFDRLAPEQQQEARAVLTTQEAQLREWAENYPPTFYHPYVLVAAEIARIESRDLEAERLYEQAIRSANENGFVQNEALAYELASKFYRARGLALVADTYLREARACYARWGADGKVHQLDQQHPQLVEVRPLVPTVTFAVRADQLDLLSAIKASQVISREILLPNLQQTLMRLALEHAGAQRGVLLLPDGETLAIHAQAEIAGEEMRVTLTQALPASTNTLPLSLLSYVRRTGEAVMLADALADGRYAADPYIARQRPRSVLGLPIVRQSQLVGILYLENNLIAGAFTPTTLTVLELLATQAAISLDHARLYTNLQQENAERQRAEAALRQAEAKYRSIFENAGEGIFQVTPAGTFLTANPAMARMLGYESSAELIAAITNLETQIYIEPARRPELLHLLDEQGSVHHLEIECYRKDRSRIWTSANIRVVHDEQGQVRYYEGMSTDITERKQAEAALRRSEERYRDLYDNAPDGYCVVDAEGLIREMNATQLTWLGYSRREVIGQLALEDILAPEGRRQIMHLLDRCKREGQLEHAEQALMASDGRSLPVRLNMRAIRNEAGHCIGYRVTIRDIAKEKELEAQLLQAQKLESLGTLVGGIAHDFNNMLTSIMGFTELVLLEVDPENQIHDDLRHIEVLGRRAADMVRQLLTFSRHSRSQKTSMALRPFLEELAKLLKRMIPETIAVDLRLGAENLVVEADPTQLQQVVTNLAVNARDAMPEGGRLAIETARVALDAAFCQAHPDLSPGWYAQLSVSDTGVGIGAAIRSRIFDPFFTTKGVGQGTGLGLSVVYGIVKNHAGAIEVESQIGHGTSIKIYLPLSDQLVAEPAAPQDELLRGTETILLVEDEPLVLEFGRTALERFGYRVLTATDGVVALEEFDSHQDEIALVILDVVMPRLGGYAAARELKRRKPTVAVLMASGYDRPEAAGEQHGEVEKYEFLRKPYRIRELAQMVRAALEPERTANQSTHAG